MRWVVCLGFWWFGWLFGVWLVWLVIDCCFCLVYGLGFVGFGFCLLVISDFECLFLNFIGGFRFGCLGFFYLIGCYWLFV